MSIDLSGKTVFITGAGGRLGIAHIDRLAHFGAIVIATELIGERFDNLSDLYHERDDVFLYPLDVCAENQVIDTFKRILSDGLRPNVINNAAITGELLMGKGRSFPDLANTSIDDWYKTVDVILLAHFL